MEPFVHLIAHTVDGLLWQVGAFFQWVGVVIWAILAIAFLLWFMLIQRALLLYRYAQADVQRFFPAWSFCCGALEGRSAHNAEAIFSQGLHGLLHRYGREINMLIALCPMVGLLGTVMGMITLFHQMALTEGSQVSAFADGIFKAIIPTMASMVVALSGLFAHAVVRYRTEAVYASVIKKMRAQA